MYELIPVAETNSYYFKTDNGTEYLITFLDSTKDYSDHDIGNSMIYELQLLKISGKSNNDKKISDTIGFAITKTLSKEENIILYICSASDGRQQVRHVMFNKWFNQLSNGDFEKIDGQIKNKDNDGDIEYISVIINKKNPSYTSTIQAFDSIFQNVISDK